MRLIGTALRLKQSRLEEVPTRCSVIRFSMIVVIIFMSAGARLSRPGMKPHSALPTAPARIARGR